MLTGIVPVLTKGSFATFYGGEIVIREIEERNKVDLQPSQVIPSFFIISSLFQMMMYVYKRIRTSGYRNIQSYISLLKKNLGMLNIYLSSSNQSVGSVENVLNLYGVVVLITISILSCFAVMSHYADIEDGAYNPRPHGKEPFPFIVPNEFFVLYFIMTFVTIIPFARSPPLRLVNELFMSSCFLHSIGSMR